MSLIEGVLCLQNLISIVLWVMSIYQSC